MKATHDREKKWRMLFTRQNKLHRARQLGIEYPRESEGQMVARESIIILFICSMNQWRSPTAEAIYADKPLVVARSAGISSKARNTVKPADLKWADVVFVMEDKHQQRLLAQYPGEMKFKELHVLDIPDNFKFMDSELVEEIRSVVDPILDRMARRRDDSSLDV